MSNFIKQFSAGWVALLLSFAGVASLYLWQPITEFFFLKTYEENIVLTVNTEVLPASKDNYLVVVTMRLTNSGNVPAVINSDHHEGKLHLEVRKIEHSPAGKWIDPAKLTLVAEKSVLAKHAGLLQIFPDAFLKEVEAITLPAGNYWIHAVVTPANSPAIQQSTVVSVSDKLSDTKDKVGPKSAKPPSI
jgi:hypothetical protein